MIDNTATTLYPGGFLNTGFASAVDPGPGRRLEARLGHRGRGLGLQADPGRRSDLQGQPDAPYGRRGPDQQGPPKPLLPAEGREPAQPLDLRQQDQRAGLPGLPVRGRADRRPLRQSRRPLYRHASASGSRSRTASTSTRSTPRPSTAGSTSSSSTWPGEDPSSLRPGAGFAPVIYQSGHGHPRRHLPPDPIQDQPTYGAALAAFQAQPQVKVMFDNGAGGSPGAPYPGFERDFSRFPIPGTRARSWYFGPNGTLTGKAPKKGGSQSFTWDKTARPRARLRRDGHGQRRPLDRQPELRLAPAARRHRRLLPDAAAQPGHRDRRGGRRADVDQGVGSRCRPPGHDL